VLGIDLFHTNLRTVDGVDIVIPNSSILSGPIKNMSAFPERIVAVTIPVSLECDIAKAMGIAREVLRALPKVQQEREQTISLNSLTGASAELQISAWVRNEDYQETRSAILTGMRERFEATGIKLG
jgi:small conductance mechanosensitive channel